MKITFSLFAFLMLLFFSISCFSKNIPSGDSGLQARPAYQAPSVNESASIAYQQSHNIGSLNDFPRLHPMIVHFPIVFILLAFVVQILSFFVFKKELSWVALFLIFLGCVGSYIATNILHGGDPNLTTLNSIARETFEKHEHFAHLTVLLSAIASVLKIISQFLFRRRWWSEALVSLFMLGAVFTITITADMGARLVHIDAIGVQGNEIPLHDDD